MTVVYVDIEHARVRSDPAHGHAAKTETARECISTTAEVPCVVVPVEGIALEQLAALEPFSIVISGCTAHWEEYDFASMAGLFDIIRAAPVPILGICGGHQLIGIAHGASWGPLGPLQEGETDLDPRFAPGQRKERGYLPLEVDPQCPLFRGLGDSPAFFQSHYWHLLDAPAGFAVRASSEWSPIQVIERLDKPVFGVEFHPERSSREHPAGYELLRNFFAVATSIRPEQQPRFPEPQGIETVDR